MTASPSVIAVVSDLIFATKITSTAATLGVAVKVVRSLDQLSTRLSQESDALVMIELDVGIRLKHLEPLPILTGEPAPAPGSTHIYELTWTDEEVTEPGITCLPSAGSCTVLTVDHVANSAQLEWTLPQQAGLFELVGVVGSFDWFATDWMIVDTTP